MNRKQDSYEPQNQNKELKDGEMLLRAEGIIPNSLSVTWKYWLQLQVFSDASLQQRAMPSNQNHLNDAINMWLTMASESSNSKYRRDTNQWQIGPLTNYTRLHLRFSKFINIQIPWKSRIQNKLFCPSSRTVCSVVETPSPGSFLFCSRRAAFLSPFTPWSAPCWAPVPGPGPGPLAHCPPSNSERSSKCRWQTKLPALFIRCTELSPSSVCSSHRCYITADAAGSWTRLRFCSCVHLVRFPDSSV